MSKGSSKASRATQAAADRQQEKNRLWVESSLFLLVTAVLAWIVYVRVVRGSDLPPIYLLSWWLLFVTRAAITSLTGRAVISPAPGSLDRLRAVLRLRAVVSVMVLALLAYPVLFYSSLTPAVSSFFAALLRLTESLATQVARIVVLAFSTLGGYVINLALSVLGNVIYNRWKSRAAQSAPAPAPTPNKAAGKPRPRRR